MKHVKFWTMEGRGVKGVMGRAEPNESHFASIYAFNSKIPITGGASGNLYLWQGGSGKAVKAHKGLLCTFFMDNKSQLLYSGALDGQIISWTLGNNNQVSQKSVVVTTNSFIPPNVPGGVLSLDVNQKGDMLIGTSGAQVWERSAAAGNKTTLFLQGHYNTG